MENIYSAVINEVIDGDTMRVTIDLGFHLTLTGKIRLHGINAPELDTPEGQKAKEFAKQFEGKEIKITSKPPVFDAFGRFLVEAFYLDGEQLISINQLMLDKGYAQPYKRKQPKK